MVASVAAPLANNAGAARAVDKQQMPRLCPDPPCWRLRAQFVPPLAATMNFVPGTRRAMVRICSFARWMDSLSIGPVSMLTVPGHIEAAGCPAGYRN